MHGNGRVPDAASREGLDDPVGKGVPGGRRLLIGEQQPGEPLVFFCLPVPGIIGLDTRWDVAVNETDERVGEGVQLHVSGAS
jgi:hypothetical protein